jgi:hypothetical protein
MLCSFSNDTVVLKIQHGECLYWKIILSIWLVRKELAHNVTLQCMSHMSYPFSADVVPTKIQRDECLCWMIIVDMWSIRRKVILPCYSVMHEPNVVLLQHRYRCTEDTVWWESMFKDNCRYVTDEERTCLTLLFCNAWARCFAPSEPILFVRRFKHVSVCNERQSIICDRWGENLFYHVTL